MGGFARNTIITFLSRILMFIIVLVASVIIARFLGPERKGIYSLAVLLPGLIVTITNLGIGSATVYHIGQKKYPLKNIFSSNFILSFIISGMSVIIGASIILFFHNIFLHDIPQVYLWVTLGLIPMTLLNGYLINILLGLQKIKKYNLIGILQLFMFLILVIFFLIILRIGVIGVIFANMVASFLVSVVLFGWIRKLTGGISYKLDSSYVKETSIYGTKVHLSNILAFLNYRLDMFIINAFINPLAVGYYSVAVGLVERLWLISKSASTVLFPRVASERNKRQRKEFTPIVSRNVLLITTVGAIFVFFLSRWIILLLYSEVYLPSVRSLQILLPGVVALSISRVLANDIAGQGKPMLNTYLAAVTVVVNVALNMVWIPKYGIGGAALASTVSYTIQMIGRLLVYSKISGNSVAKIIFIQKSDILLYRKLLSSLVKRVMPVS